MPTALVVDDSRAVRTILTRTLAGLGYEVIQAGDGQEALSVLDKRPDTVNLILLDWNMPVMTGLDVVKNVRANDRYGATKIMMVTTETEIEQMSKALEAGANEYVMKPFTREIIEDKLRILGEI